MNHSLEYTKRVWLTSILLSLVFSILTILTRTRNIHDVTGVFTLFLGLPAGVLFMGLVTIPSAIVLYFSVQLLLKHNINSLLSKLMLSLLGILLVCAQVAAMGELRFTVGYAIILLPYWTAIVFSVWIYKLNCRVI